MIDVRLAMRLKRAGLAWHPRPGDRFAVPQPELLGQVFTLSDMTIEVHQRPGGPVLGFNGTTEWALDSVQADDVVWLPAEHQLRSLLGSAFRELGVDGGDEAGGQGGDGISGHGAVGAGGHGAGEAAGTAEDPVAGSGGDGISGPVGAGQDGPPSGAGFRVLAEIPGSGERAFRAPVAEDAYALALLALIRRATA